jgi:hypothetical protein
MGKNTCSPPKTTKDEEANPAGKYFIGVFLHMGSAT